ncbi:MAG: hypothetical protein OK456_02600 [Thaumarchaeota archaeon]|nr:hypothetical protein [Nitrososphaerota archaeon]
MIGLIVLVVGELAANAAQASLDAEAVIAAVAFAFLVLSVALR